MNLTLDSSVFVEAVTRGVHQSLCIDLIKSVYLNRKITLFEPVLMLFEFVNAVERAGEAPRTKKKRLEFVLKICSAYVKRGNTRFIDLNMDLWNDWSSYRNRNCTHKTQDEIFIHTASKYSSCLVSLDKAVLLKPRCRNGSCSVMSPYKCLKVISKLR